MIEKNFTIIEPKPSLWTIICVSFILTVYFGLTYHFITSNSHALGKTYVYLLVLTYFVFRYMVFPYIVTKIAHINFAEKKIKYELEIGPLKIRRKWKEFKNLKYISVFKVKENYHVNLWYEKRKILNLFMTPELNEAFENAYKLSEKFNVDLVDATIKGHHNYVDKLYYQEHNEIKHL